MGVDDFSRPLINRSKEGIKPSTSDQDNHETNEKCDGCDFQTIDNNCLPYFYPQTKWTPGRSCPMATHLKKEAKKTEKQLDPIKASKQMVGKK